MHGAYNVKFCLFATTTEHGAPIVRCDGLTYTKGSLLLPFKQAEYLIFQVIKQIAFETPQLKLNITMF
jgi:hypothetical protein